MAVTFKAVVLHRRLEAAGADGLFGLCAAACKSPSHTLATLEPAATPPAYCSSCPSASPLLGTRPVTRLLSPAPSRCPLTPLPPGRH